MKEQPRIAVVIPVYNAEKKLTSCIKSILHQSFSDFSLVLVDDGSTDTSGCICDEFAIKDSRVHCLHQKNKGSVEARKAGVLSQIAQACSYIFLSDADDFMPRFALEQLYKVAIKEGADCVCGDTVKAIRNHPISSSHKAPCFNIKEPEILLHDEIIDRLYISCFGVNNYPVSLYAKLYKTDLLTHAINFPPLVRFMGEDLSVTLRVMPAIRKLAIIPNIVYYYNIGGGTSRFNPDLLDDFLALYREKKKILLSYPSLTRGEYLISAELKNVVRTWLQSCYQDGRYTKEELYKEISRVCSLPEVYEAIRQEKLVETDVNGFRAMLEVEDAEGIYEHITQRCRKQSFRKKVFSFLTNRGLV